MRMIKHETTPYAIRYLPPELLHFLQSRATGDGIVGVKGRFFPQERRVLHKRKKCKVSAWAARHRVVHMSSLPGRWRNETTPHVAGIMDASFYPSVRNIVICKTVQSAGTEGVLNCIGYAASREPGPIMFVYADEAAANKMAEKRIIPMFQSSRELKGLLSKTTKDFIDVIGSPIDMAWSGSASTLSSTPVRYLVRDEINKWKDAKDEASSMELAKQRTTTWEGREKIWDICTPTTEKGAISVRLQECDVVFEFWPQCPYCKTHQPMRFEHIDFCEVTDPALMERDRAARYLCCGEECGVLWDDNDRNSALLTGEWRDSEGGQELFAYLEEHNPHAIGFHVPSWVSRFVSLSSAAASFLRYKKTNDLEDLKIFRNKHCAEAWVEDLANRSESQIRLLCDDRAPGIVPSAITTNEGKRMEQVAALVCGVDTQDNSLPYVVRAFGFGENATSWLVDYGHLADFEALDTLMYNTAFLDAEGNEYTISLTAQDAMGHRTADVYEFCADRKGLIIPCQGRARSLAILKYSARDFYPNTSRRILGGLNLVQHNVNFFKSRVNRALGTAPNEQGALMLHREFDVSADAHLDSGIDLVGSYVREMLVEYYDSEKDLWVCPDGKDNHFWDCEVLCQVAAWHLGVRHWAHPLEVSPVPQSPKKRERNHNSTRSTNRNTSRNTSHNTRRSSRW